MKIEALHIGMKVKHLKYLDGVVKSISEHTAEIRFDDALRTIDPETSDLQPAEAHAALSGLELPLKQLIEQTVHAAIADLGIPKPETVVEQLGLRWRKGRLVMHPADSTLQTKEVDLETFFHKIVMVRNNLRVLEQKINSSEQMSSAEKFDWQQYITRSYGSLTTFNVLFKEKEDQF
ncbi:MAG: hypothetical protein HY043_05670 [Verrucomicrobia bacterium]|nr:hypothetical protein [Verrucomicrobiota bacterium]